MSTPDKLHSLSDDELLLRLSELLQQSRRTEADLVAHIGEVDERRLYARRASSMFVFCIEVLHLSEPEAYLRIGVARAARKYPALLTMLRDGRLHLSGIALLAPHLTEANCERVLERAACKSKRKIEELVAELSPKPDVPATIRKLPSPPATPRTQLFPDGVENSAPSPAQAPQKPAPKRAAPPPPPRPEPLSPERFKVTFTANRELRNKLETLQALMHEDLAAVIEAAVTEKLDRLEARRYGKTPNPRKSLQEADTSPDSRHIPAPVKRAVRARDRDQCTYVDGEGRRCTERRNLQFHHRTPFALGGDRSVDNIYLVCPVHNAYYAERDYGKKKMEPYRRRADRISEPAAFYEVMTSRGSRPLRLAFKIEKLDFIRSPRGYP